VENQALVMDPAYTNGLDLGGKPNVWDGLTGRNSSQATCCELPCQRMVDRTGNHGAACSRGNRAAPGQMRQWKISTPVHV